MVFKTDRQRRGFFAGANAPRATTRPSFVAFSYRTPNKKLGTFSSMDELFKKFPSEKKAFMRVIKFRKKTGIRVNTIAEIKNIKRNQKTNRRWDR